MVRWAVTIQAVETNLRLLFQQAMGLEKTAADIESDAAATLLAGADEEGRLAEEMMSAKAKSAEGDTLEISYW